MTVMKDRSPIKDGRTNDAVVGCFGEAPNAVHMGKQSTSFQACYNLVKANLGAGIFSFPVAYVRSGFFASIILLILTSVFIYWTSSILAKLADCDTSRCSTYEGIVERYLGNWGKWVCSVSGIVLTFGALCVYVVVIADSVPPILLNFTPWTESCIINNTCDYSKTAVFFMDRKIVSILISVFLITPLSSIRNATYLSYVSVVGLLSLCAIVIITAVKSNLPSTQKGSLSGSDLLTGIVPSGISFVVSTTAYANIVNQNQFPIFESLMDKSINNRLKVIRNCLVFCVCIMLFYSIATYVPLNDRINGNVLNLFSHSDVAINVARALFAIEIILTAPVVIYICRSFILNAAYGGLHRAPKLGIYAITFLLVMAAVVIASSFCKFDIAISLTGGLSASIMAFALPQMCWVSRKLVTGGRWRDWKVILVCSTTVFALLLIILSIVDLVDNIKNYSGSSCAYSFI